MMDCNSDSEGDQTIPTSGITKLDQLGEQSVMDKTSQYWNLTVGRQKGQTVFTPGSSQQPGAPSPSLPTPSREYSAALSMGSLLESLGHYNSASGSVVSEDGQGGGANEFLLDTGILDMMSRSRKEDNINRSDSSRLNSRNHSQPISRTYTWEASQSSSRSVSRDVIDTDPSDSSGCVSVSPRPSMAPARDKQRGLGYRKLFQQVTKVGRGQKLSDSLTPEITVSMHAVCVNRMC